MQTLYQHICEARMISLKQQQPTGLVDRNEFSSAVYNNFIYTMLQSVAKYAKLKRNAQTSGDLWEELSLKKDFKLYSIKRTSLGKNGDKVKSKEISRRLVSDNPEEIYRILFGKDNIYNDFDSLVSFIVSTDFTNRDSASNIFDYFIKKCEKDAILKKKVYKIRPYLNDKLKTII